MPKQTILKLQAILEPEVEGYGEQLTFRIPVYQTKKTGRRVDYLLEIKACRHSVRQLAEAIANMQARDLEHIERQRARLDREVAPLKRS